VGFGFLSCCSPTECSALMESCFTLGACSVGWVSGLGATEGVERVSEGVSAECSPLKTSLLESLLESRLDTDSVLTPRAPFFFFLELELNLNASSPNIEAIHAIN